jgi:tryptophan synthase alpha chain
MGRIRDAMDRAAAENRTALVIYFCAGDPDLESTPALIKAIADAGADIIELGVPFSDPTADGVAIQLASERSLARGTTMRGVLAAVREARKLTDVPIMLFGYYNPIMAYGEAKLVEDAAKAGVDGFLVVDLPPEEAEPLRAPILAHGLDFVPLIAPTSDAARTQRASDAATSFLYYVSITGVTGAVTADIASASTKALAMQQKTGKPVALGFGVKSKEDVAAVAKQGVAGVAIGSAVVRCIEAAKSPGEAVTAVSALVRELRSGTAH